MVESIVLGIVQGITEWLPISSEGAMLLVKMRFFGGKEGLGELIQLALFFHLGTFFAALWYFRDDIKRLVGALFSGSAPEENRKIILFLIIATGASGVIGMALIFLIKGIEESLEIGGRIVTAAIGLLLLGTAAVQFRAKKLGLRGPKDLQILDGLLLGIVQGFSVLPGLSRSGLTVSALLLRKFNDVQALRLSFLMSLPAILGGNLVLNWEKLEVSFGGVVGLFFSFLFGLFTIHLLLKLARKVNFAYFVFFFGILTLISVFL